MSSDSQMGWDAILSSYTTRLSHGVVSSRMFLEDEGGEGVGVRKRGPAVILHFMTRSVADRIRPPLHYVQFVKYIFPRNRTTSN